ncbi:gamma carbonic anhydrase family protein [Arthrobacter sp. FW305-123]|nr:gamma carbonic anhydrase family protein [Arthrobacter sp. FW305-123]
MGKPARTGVSIWYGAVIRADGNRISVQAGSNIQDNCVLHSDPGFPVRVGAGVSVGHAAIIHGASIGDDVIIGMGATVMNSARVCPETIVAANALVPEGKVVPSGVLFAGVPGKVVRTLSPKEIGDIRINAEKCHELALTHSSLSLPTS